MAPFDTPATPDNTDTDDLLLSPDGVLVRVWERPTTYRPWLLHPYRPEDPDLVAREVAREDGVLWEHRGQTGEDDIDGYVHVGRAYHVSMNPPRVPEPWDPEQDALAAGPDDRDIVQSGWLSPGGVLYPCGYHEHAAFAVRVAHHLLAEEDFETAGFGKPHSVTGEPSPDSPRVLEVLGWQKMHGIDNGPYPRAPWFVLRELPHDEDGEPAGRYRRGDTDRGSLPQLLFHKLYYERLLADAANGQDWLDDARRSLEDAERRLGEAPKTNVTTLTPPSR